MVLAWETTMYWSLCSKIFPYLPLKHLFQQVTILTIYLNNLYYIVGALLLVIVLSLSIVNHINYFSAFSGDSKNGDRE